MEHSEEAFSFDRRDYKGIINGSAEEYAAALRVISSVLKTLDSDPRKKGLLHTLLSDMKRDGKPYVEVQTQYWWTGGLGPAGIACGQKYKHEKVSTALASLKNYIRFVPQDAKAPKDQYLIILKDVALEGFVNGGLARDDQKTNAVKSIFVNAKKLLLTKAGKLPKKESQRIPDAFFLGVDAVDVAAKREAEELVERKDYDDFFQEMDEKFSPSRCTRLLYNVKKATGILPKRSYDS